MSQTEMKPHWKCGECGYILQAGTPPKTCPECRQEGEFKDVTGYIPECGCPGQGDPRLK